MTIHAVSFYCILIKVGIGAICLCLFSGGCSANRDNSRNIEDVAFTTGTFSGLTAGVSGYSLTKKNP